MLLLIDNYDSFTYNLVHFLGDIGVKSNVVRNDSLCAQDAIAMKPDYILLSPGPCDPDQAGICLELVELAGEANIPLLGVCLGHQALGQAFGGKIIRADQIMHGKTDQVHHTQKGLFHGIEQDLTVTRYHSLIVKRETLPDCFDITAETKDGTIMGLSHKDKPLHGLQFHPESIATQHGHQILKNFVEGQC